MRADHFERGPNRLGIVQVHAGDQGVRVAPAHHHGSEVVAVVETTTCLVETHALALASSPDVLRVLLAPRRRRRGLDLDALERDVVRPRVVLDRRAIAEQDRLGDPVFDADAAGADDLRLLALAEDGALRIARRAVDETAHDAACSPEA